MGESHTIDTAIDGAIDIRGSAFARRLANLLTDRRDATGATLRQLAKSSNGAFSARFLRAAESGRAHLDEESVCELAALYGADLAEILPTRMPLRIPAPGVIATSGVTAQFDEDDPDSLLTAYLLMIRQLRAQQREPMIDLRREDVETIAEYLHEPGPSIVERLGALMGATQLHRRAMAGMFIAGAIVIGLAGSGVAAWNATADDPAADPAPPPTNGAVVAPPPSTATVSTVAPSSDVTTTAAATTADSSTPPIATSAAAADFADVVVARDLDHAGAVAPSTTAAPASEVTTAPVVVTPPTAPAPAPTPTATPTPATSAPPQVATGEPPVPPAPVTTQAEITIPDVPYDLPTTTAAPTTTDAPATTDAPQTGPPPAPPTSEAQVATGPPPVPGP